VQRRLWRLFPTFCTVSMEARFTVRRLHDWHIDVQDLRVSGLAVVHHSDVANAQIET